MFSVTSVTLIFEVQKRCESVNLKFSNIMNYCAIHKSCVKYFRGIPDKRERIMIVIEHDYQPEASYYYAFPEGKRAVPLPCCWCSHRGFTSSSPFIVILLPSPAQAGFRVVMPMPEHGASASAATHRDGIHRFWQILHQNMRSEFTTLRAA